MVARFVETSTWASATEVREGAYLDTTPANRAMCEHPKADFPRALSTPRLMWTVDRLCLWNLAPGARFGACSAPNNNKQFVQRNHQCARRRISARETTETRSWKNDALLQCFPSCRTCPCSTDRYRFESIASAGSRPSATDLP